MNALEYQTIKLRCKATGVNPSTGDVTLTLEQHEAKPSTAELLARLVAMGAEVDVVAAVEQVKP